MYLITVIPLHRKLPDGQLSYISKDKINIGTIIDAPIKKSIEKSLVIGARDVTHEKSYIKSLPWKLISIQKNKDDIIIPKKIVDVLYDFCSYSLVSPDVVVRACFSKVEKQNSKGKSIIETLVITSSNQKLKKLNNQQYHIATFQNFLSYFTNNLPKLKKIIIDDPESLSNYGMFYLGFDPVVFIVMLAKNLDIDINFKSLHTRLRYQEWKIKQIKKSGLYESNLKIIGRDNEKKQDIQNPISKSIQDVIYKNMMLRNKRILVLGSAKNFAPKTICGDCGQFHICINCNNPLKLVKNNRKYAGLFGISGEYIFICINCNRAENSIAKCRNCESWNLMPIGYGIERIIENLENVIPKKEQDRIYNLSDSVSVKKIKNWNEKGGIIIGQLNLINEIEDCDICIVPSLGALLYNEFFESVERVRDILGYSQNCKKGMIVSVLKESEKEFLQLDEKTWQKNEYFDRKTLNYPPYARHVIFTLDPYASRAEKIQQEIVKILNSHTEYGVNLEKNNIGQIKIHASFPNTNWSINNNNYSLPQKIKESLFLFMKYLKVEVY